MRCSFVLSVFLIPVVYGLQCCNTTNSDGTGFSTTDTPDLNITDQISVCLWVRPIHDEEYDIVSYVDPKQEPVLYVSTRKVIFYDTAVANISVFDEANSTHICVTWHRDKGVSIFLNGKQHRNTVPLSEISETDMNFTGSWSAGLQTEGKTYPSKGGLNGSLCDFTIWSEELTSNYISTLYNTTNGYTTDGADNAEAVVSPLPSYSWQNFTHHNYTFVNDSFCPNAKGKGHGIRLGNLDPVASKFVILFLVIIGVVIGFAGLFMCSEREIAVKRAQKRLKDEDNFSIDNASTHSVT